MGGHLNPEHEERLQIAMVALTRAEMAGVDAVQMFLREAWPELTTTVQLAASGTVLDVRVSDGSFALVSVVSQPIPWGDLGPCVDAAEAYWADAQTQMRSHRAHAIVAFTMNDGDALDRALMLTRIVAAVTACSDAVGVYWGDGAVVQPAAAFVAEAQAMSREYLPLYLWLGFYGRQELDGRLTVRTYGLRRFRLMDVEVVAAPEDLESMLGRAFNVAHYLLDNGPVLNDGDTIGFTEGERLKVRHAPSVSDALDTVYRVEEC
jgi:hypothetical protein